MRVYGTPESDAASVRACTARLGIELSVAGGRSSCVAHRCRGLFLATASYQLVKAVSSFQICSATSTLQDLGKPVPGLSVRGKA